MNGFIKKISLLAFLTLSSGDAASTISSRAGQYSVDGMKVFVVKQDEMTFGVSEDVPKNSDFFVNANFFDDNGPIGLLVVDGERKSRSVRGGGFFYVKGRKVFINGSGAPRKIRHGAQTLLLAIEDGEVNKDLMLARHGRERTYRTLLGQTESGDIIFVAPGRTSFVTIPDIVDIAVVFNVKNAILLDAGSSVDYRFESTRFKSVPHFMKDFMEIEEPKSYIYGNFNVD
mgnify:CR=1 FL=1